MERDEARRAEALDRYWDSALDRGAARTAVQDVEPVAAEIIRGVWSLGDISPLIPDPQRAWRDLLRRSEVHAMAGSVRGVTARVSDGLPVWSLAQPRVKRGGFSLLATAALVAFALVASVLIFGRFMQSSIVPVIAPPVVSGPAEFVWLTAESPDLIPFADPYHLAIDPHGNLWVPDSQANRFSIYAPDGTLLQTWGSWGSDQGEFFFLNARFSIANAAGAAAFDDQGNLFVADPGNHRVQKFGPDLRFVTAWGSRGEGDGQFVGMNDLAVDGRGLVYVLDAKREDVQIFDNDGEFLARWGSRGLEAGELLSPRGLAVDPDGNIIIADTGNNRIQKFSADGTFLAAWGGVGSGPGEFRTPDDVAIDSQGRVYVTDWSNNRVQVLDPSGEYLTEWGEYGAEPGEFDAPAGIVLDKAGNVYVGEQLNNRIQKFRLLPPLAPE